MRVWQSLLPLLTCVSFGLTQESGLSSSISRLPKCAVCPLSHLVQRMLMATTASLPQNRTTTVTLRGYQLDMHLHQRQTAERC